MLPLFHGAGGLGGLGGGSLKEEERNIEPRVSFIVKSSIWFSLKEEESNMGRLAPPVYLIYAS